MKISNFFQTLLGKPIASKQSSKQSLSVLTGVPALGLDALASTAYGPEASLILLLTLGSAGYTYFLPVIAGVIVVLFLLYLSYMQTIAAYPKGSSSYIVASDNLGQRIGLVAAIALLLDFLLNVAVGISAGIGVVVSALPFLHPYTRELCLFILLILTLLNLRGVRESGMVFIVPVILFILCLGITLIIGLVKLWVGPGVPHAIVAPPSLPSASTTVTLWLLLASFANGLTAMTGIEAVSNATALFKKPNVLNARITLTIIVGTLILFLIGIAILCPAFHIVAMNEETQGYQTILSQLVSAITGKGFFYYFSISSIFIVLVYSAQTSFVAFPRVCRLLAEDNFLPSFFAERGPRLVFTAGIVLLAFFSGILIYIFKGNTLKLIPLFAIGAFTAFVCSQIGMVVYWIKNKEPGTRIKLLCNIAGALATFIALCIIIVAKFARGGWIILLAIVLLYFLLIRINKHFTALHREINTPLKLKTTRLDPPIIIIPIESWNKITERAVHFGLLLSENIICLHISTEDESNEHWLRKIWSEKIEAPAKTKKMSIPQLKIIKSPFRKINRPIVKFIKEIRKEHPHQLIMLVIPELVTTHWYERVLHNLHSNSLRTLLFLENEHKTVVVNIPWYEHKNNYG